LSRNRLNVYVKSNHSYHVEYAILRTVERENCIDECLKDCVEVERGRKRSGMKYSYLFDYQLKDIIHSIKHLKTI
jgi:hypothetical protein